MLLLEKYVEGLNRGDAEAISRLFTENCRFDDAAARPLGAEDLVVGGSLAIKQAFDAVLSNSKIRAEVVKLNANSMEYDVYLGDVKLECIGCATLKNGLIDEYIVRPR